MKKTLDEVLGKERKLHWRFIGYKEKILNKNGQEELKWMSEVTVNHYKTEKEAEDAAKELLDRPFWHLKDVWECTQCQTVEEQKKMMKALQKHLE